MSTSLTLILLGLSVAAAVFCGWRGARPPNPLKVRMVPWRFLMILFAALVALLLIHLVRAGAGAPPV